MKCFFFLIFIENFIIKNLQKPNVFINYNIQQKFLIIYTVFFLKSAYFPNFFFIFSSKTIYKDVDNTEKVHSFPVYASWSRSYSSLSFVTISKFKKKRNKFNRNSISVYCVGSFNCLSILPQCPMRDCMALYDPVCGVRWDGSEETFTNSCEYDNENCNQSK